MLVRFSHTLNNYCSMVYTPTVSVIIIIFNIIENKKKHNYYSLNTYRFLTNGHDELVNNTNNF